MPRPVPTSPALTLAEAQAARTVRARGDASSCILLAVVTSPEVSAKLIDRAIEHARIADHGVHLAPEDQRRYSFS